MRVGLLKKKNIQNFNSKEQVLPLVSRLKDSRTRKDLHVTKRRCTLELMRSSRLAEASSLEDAGIIYPLESSKPSNSHSQPAHLFAQSTLNLTPPLTFPSVSNLVTRTGHCTAHNCILSSTSNLTKHSSNSWILASGSFRISLNKPIAAFLASRSLSGGQRTLPYVPSYLYATEKGDASKGSSIHSLSFRTWLRRERTEGWENWNRGFWSWVRVDSKVVVPENWNYRLVILFNYMAIRIWNTELRTTVDLLLKIQVRLGPY